MLGQQTIQGPRQVLAAGGPIQHVYDADGRLIGTVDPAAQTAKMFYDADGNVTSISTYNSTTVSIIGATPNAAAIGAAVKVYGTDYSSTPSQNAVTFNGVAATVTAASFTELDVIVPAGATTGTVKVTAPGGSATSTFSFTVLGVRSPTVTSVSAAVVDSGAAFTISGTNFQTAPATNNEVVLGHYQTTVTSATTTSISVTAPPVGAGQITVATPYGKASSAGDVFIPPAPYTAAQVSATGIAHFNQTTSLTISTPATIGLLALDATFGQRATFSFDESGMNGCCNNFAFYSFDGSVILNGGAGFVDTFTFPATGTYMFGILPGGSNTGIARVTVNNVPPDVTTSISLPVVGSSAQASVTVTTPGQDGTITFNIASITTGMRFAINGTPACSNCNNMTIVDPSGITLWNGGMGNWTEDISATTTGTYTIYVNYLGAATGTASVTMYNVPVDLTSTIAFPAMGSSTQASVTINTPGQNANFTFSIPSITTGMRFAINGVPAGSNYNNMLVLDPNGTQLWGGGMSWTDNIAPTLAGTYTIKIDYLGMATGTASVTLYNVPLDPSASMSFPAAGSSTQASLTTTTPAQNANFTFSATTGAVVTFTFDESQISGCCNQFTVLNPDGTTLSSTGAGTIGPLTLAQTGTYTISVNYAGLNTGTATVTLTAPTFGAAVRSPSATTATRTPGARIGASAPSPRPSTSSAPQPKSSPQPSAAPTSNTPSHPDWTPRTLPGGNVDDQIYAPLPVAMPDLRAPPGVTALAGRSLQLDGKPLAGVTFSIGARTARTDGSGRFLLTGIPSGRQVLRIDGTTADRAGAAYGIYEVAIQIDKGTTNSLAFINWMTRLDMAHAITIPSPTKVETVLTTPYIPGLEVHLPAGSVLKDDSGKVVTQLSVTAVPVNRPPFPLPIGVQVPIYFTVQPGGTYILPKGARLIYPNYAHQTPGSRVEFWDYDPDQKGWYVYGHGTVTKDGKQVVPDAGVVVWQFSGAMINSGFLTWLLGKLKDLWNYDGDPVALSSGDFVLDKTDLALPGSQPLAIDRAYNALDSVSRSFGIGSTFSYDINLNSTNQYQVVDLYLPGFSPIHYVRISPGTGFADAVFQTTSTPGNFYMSTIAWNGNGWNLKLKGGTTFVFGENAPLQSISDAYGNRITLIRSQGRSGNITTILSTSGRWIKLTYDTSNRITQAQDNSGRKVIYAYDTSGRLHTVTDPNGGITTYGYDTSNRMTTITDPLNLLYLTNHYDSNGRVSQQDLVNTSQHFLFTYTLDGNGKVTKTDVTDPRGVKREVTFNSDGFNLSDEGDVGGPAQELTQIQRQAGTGLATRVTDPLNRVTQLGYDSAGNLNTATVMFGTSEAQTYQFTYEPVRNRLQTYTDPRQKTTTITYDDINRTATMVDPLGHQTVITLNSNGQEISAQDALQHSWTFAFLFGDPASITDPLGNTTSLFYDGAGRQIATTDPIGQVAVATYDPLNEITKITDPMNFVTSYVYDAEGNLKSVTDPRSSVTKYTYDTSNRTLTRTDPNNRVEKFNTFDANGNPTSFTDQKAQTTCLTFDDLNRLTFVGFAASKACNLSPTYQSSTSYTYDLGNRVHTIVDSAAGTVTRDWTDFDQLKDEVTPQGTVAYTYDTANRIHTITVPGQTAYTYNFDDANRLQSIQQGATTLLSLVSDNANRLTSQTLPDGIVDTYAYDNAGHVTGITYSKGTTTLGTLTYAADQLGRVGALSGSWARTNIPAAVSSATYDAANQVTKRAAKTFTYDANGNLTSDGTNTYSWNARDQLTSTSSGGTVTYTYDGTGRRTSTKAGTTTTSYLYAGMNSVQEMTNGAVTANQVPAPAVDVNVARIDSTGTSSYLTDALGSTVAVANSSGTVQTQYTYDPFGATTATGSASSNTFDFTGRQKDTSGLYYNRARYYSPTQQRFISSDPAGFAGGNANLYAYAQDSPTNLTDPTGLVAVADTLVACAVGAAINAVADWIGNSLAGRKTTVGDLVKSAAVGCVIGALVTIVGPFVGDILFGAEGGAGAAATAARVFWSGRGAQAAAEEWATANGARAIGQTAVGQLLEDMGKAYGSRAIEPAWEIVSRGFARAAAGEVNVFIGPSTRAAGEVSIWAGTEFPTLLDNPAVTRIIFHYIGGA